MTFAIRETGIISRGRPAAALAILSYLRRIHASWPPRPFEADPGFSCRRREGGISRVAGFLEFHVREALDRARAGELHAAERRDDRRVIHFTAAGNQVSPPRILAARIIEMGVHDPL